MTFGVETWEWMGGMSKKSLRNLGLREREKEDESEDFAYANNCFYSY